MTNKEILKIATNDDIMFLLEKIQRVQKNIDSGSETIIEQKICKNEIASMIKNVKCILAGNEIEYFD